MSMDHLPNEPAEQPESAPTSQGVPTAFENHDRTKLPTPDDKPEPEADDNSWPQSGFGSFP